MMQKVVSKLSAQNTIFFCCDMQTVFNNPKLIYGIEGVLQASKMMNEIAGIMKIPVIATEHNPKVFGITIPEIKEVLPTHHYLYEKYHFSMINEQGNKILSDLKERDTVIIYGIETHVCINQTCLDLLEKGYKIHLITDATSSSKPLFRSTALQKLSQQGVLLNTTQGVMFELLGNYKVSEFKECIKLVKKYPNDQIQASL